MILLHTKTFCGLIAQFNKRVTTWHRLVYKNISVTGLGVKIFIQENKKIVIGGVPEHFNAPFHLGIRDGIFAKHGMLFWGFFRILSLTDLEHSIPFHRTSFKTAFLIKYAVNILLYA